MNIILFIISFNFSYAGELDMKCMDNIKKICGTKKITSDPDKMTNEEMKILECRLGEIVKCIKPEK